MNWIYLHTACALLISAVSSQECIDTVTVGSLSHDNNIVALDKTFILAGYTVPCSGTVVAWEFCYQISGAGTSATFYPGIWMITGIMGVNTDYTLVQSNTVTYDQSVPDPQDPTNIYPCQIFNLSDTDQFTAPAGSVVGLYSNEAQTQLLHTNTNTSITTYRLSGNQSSVNNGGNSNDVNYNIAIRVYLDVVDVSTTMSTVTSTQTDDMSTIATITTSTIATITTSTSISTTTTTTTVTMATVTSVPFTSTADTTTPIVMPSFTPPASGGSTGTSSDDSSSTVVGVVVGCVMGVIIFVIIVILLVWYQRRRRWRKNEGTQGVVHCNNPELKDSEDNERFSDHQYSLMKHNTAMNGVIIVESNYETADNSGYSSADSYNNTIEMMHYMDSTGSTHKGYAKASSSNDYEALPTLTANETLYSQISNSFTPYQYEVAVSSIFRDDTEYSTASAALADNEEIYEDPGHREEKIYAWFEKKKFPKIKINDIKILQVLGSGEFGVVNLALWSNGSTDTVQVAVKTLNSQCSESDRVKFLREAAIMGQFVHNNVVQLHGVVTEEKNMMIVLEYMPKGDLRENLIDIKHNINEYRSLPVKLLNFCRQIAAGMNYLANKQFVHRDLAARNILVSSDDVCKIADFGMARDVGDDIYYIATGGKIPLKWTAPEAIYYKKFSAQSDVWSFGCVMYEIWSLGHKPSEDLDGIEYIEKITTGYRLPPPPGCPRAIYELMIQCWHPTAKNRPLAGLVLQILQNSNSALLTSSVQVTDDDVTSESQSVMLGAPLTAGSQLYLDLQQRYTTA